MRRKGKLVFRCGKMAAGKSTLSTAMPLSERAPSNFGHVITAISSRPHPTNTSTLSIMRAPEPLMS